MFSENDLFRSIQIMIDEDHCQQDISEDGFLTLAANPFFNAGSLELELPSSPSSFESFASPSSTLSTPSSPLSTQHFSVNTTDDEEEYSSSPSFPSSPSS